MSIYVDELASKLTAHLAHEESDGLALIDEFLTPEEWQTFAREHGRRLINDASTYVPWLLDQARPRCRRELPRHDPTTIGYRLPGPMGPGLRGSRPLGRSRRASADQRARPPEGSGNGAPRFQSHRLQAGPSPDTERKLGFALLVIATAQLMLVLDDTIVNVALPSMQRSLHIPTSHLNWVASFYALTFGGLLLAGGRAGDLYGRLRVFRVGIVVFAIASMAGGFAPNATTLLIARLVQGCGAAIAAPAPSRF